MQPTSWRVQLRIVGLGYAGVFVVAAGLLLARYFQERMNPVDAAGGMWAFGDLLLGIFIICLFMIPTFFLIWVLAGFEGPYLRYSQFLLGLSVSAPVCLGLFYFGKSHVSENLRLASLCRLGLAPFIILGMGASRLLARFGRTKTLTSYALLIEGLTLSVGVVLLFLG